MYSIKLNNCPINNVEYCDDSIYSYLRNHREEVKNKKGGEKMLLPYKYIANVSLLEDAYQKDYNFALYEEDAEEVFRIGNYEDMLVVVNPKNKNRKILGKLNSIVGVEVGSPVLTAQVVGIVNMKNYNNRVLEEERRAEIAKKKAAIEKELEVEISKRKNAEYYEEMARKYSDNPKISKLVLELKNLE